DPANHARCQSSETADADHGRVEQRRHWVCHDIGWLKSDRRYPGERTFPRLATIAMIEATAEHDGRTRHETRYYISSATLDAKAFAAAVPAHWRIENRLHWVLDVVFHDSGTRRSPRGGHPLYRGATVGPARLQSP